TPKSNGRFWGRKGWMLERWFARGGATSPVILANSRAWASVLGSTEVLSVGGGDTVTVGPRRSYGYERDHRIGRLRSSLGDGRLIRLQGEAGHRRGGCDVEGVDSPAHGNHHSRIAGGDRRLAQPVALGAEDDRGAFGGGGGEFAQPDGIIVESQRRKVETVLLQCADPVGPGFDPRPGDLEHRAHGDSDRAPVERIRAARGDEDGIDSEGRRRTEDRTDVRVVDDVFDDDQASGVG